MVKLTFVEHDGRQYRIDVEPGTTLMRAAVTSGVAGIEGECGGACACATCHVYIPAEWQPLLKAAGEDEREMLLLGIDVDERSRLGCQIVVEDGMQDMRIHLPERQR